MLKKILHILATEISPYPDGSISDDSEVAKQHKITEDGLLECCYVAQVDSVQTCLSHGTCTEEESIDVSKWEKCLSIVAIFINAAAVHYNR